MIVDGGMGVGKGVQNMSLKLGMFKRRMFQVHLLEHGNLCRVTSC
jgi:hypothetical protein